MAQYSTRRQVVGQVAQLQCPEGVSRCLWRGVRAYLQAIASFYPRPYPSQQKLADLVGCDVRSIQRYQKLAVAHGLLLVKADAGTSKRRNHFSKTNLYHIVVPPKLSPSNDDNLQCKGTSGSLREPAVETSSSPAEKTRVGPAARMAHSKEPERLVNHSSPSRPTKRPAPSANAAAIVSSVVEKGRISPRPRAKMPEWKQLLEHFVTEWMSMIEHTKQRDSLRRVEILLSIKAVRDYLNAHFLGPNAISPRPASEVAKMMTRFVEDCYTGQVRIKDGQSAWLAFTGNWGRDPQRPGIGTTESDIDRYFESRKS